MGPLPAGQSAFPVAWGIAYSTLPPAFFLDGSSSLLKLF